MDPELTGLPPAPGQPVLIAGPGRLGRSLALACRQTGLPVVLLSRRPRFSRGGSSPESAGCPVRLLRLEPVAGAPRLLIMTVPDDAIQPAAALLAGELPDGALAGWIVLHTSGVHPAAVLAPLQNRGAATGSWHPLQTFIRPSSRRFRQIPVTLEGDPAAIEAGRRLALRLGAHPVELPAELKPLYHCISTICCAHAAAPLLFCRTALNRFPLPLQAGLWRGWQRLAGQSIRQMNRLGRPRLTGPAVRGDLQTLALHKAILARDFPGWLPIYSIITEYLQSLPNSSAPGHDSANNP